MSQNLITLERAKLSISNATTDDDRTIEVLVAGVSRAIEKYCARTFSLQSYDEMQNLQPDGRLQLSRFPIQSVEAVRHSPTVVAQVQNTNTATNQQARVTVTSTGLDLDRIASGVKTRVSVAFGTYVTIETLMAQIRATGSSWTGLTQGSTTADYGLWPSADLWIPPMRGDALRSTGSLNCRGVYAPLYMHVDELSSYHWDHKGYITPYNVFGPVVTEDDYAPAGDFRVQYTAGFAEIPEDIQEAAGIWVGMLWYISSRDPNASILSGTGVQTGYLGGGMPETTRQLIAPYKIRRV